MEKRPKIGISACLLGEQVRYDGGHKYDPDLIAALQGYFDLLPVCPEAGCGLGIPREAMRLEGEVAKPRLVGIESRVDLTDRLLGYCLAKGEELAREDLCGFVFKARSPSCGVQGVPVHEQGASVTEGRGLFAREVVRCFPLLPVGEEGSLADPVARDLFIARVLGYARST
jgi:uncharacterized protein YbbK (DUF523 family)